MGARALRMTLRFLGGSAVFFGGLTVVAGVDSIIGAGEASATLDSELRYYSAWYVAAGVFLIRAARRVESERVTIRILMATLFVGGLSRAVSMIVVGIPHPVSVTLMVLELSIPLVIVPWQAAVARRETAPGSP